jgi:IrrE N-terminal-like domain
VRARLSERQIRGQATNLLKAWLSSRRGRVLPINVREIALSVDLRVEEIEELGGVHLMNPWVESGVDVVGILDRRHKTVTISKRQSLAVQRFTLAHEIAHWVLHPGLTHHRERVQSENLSPRFNRLPEEREADIFASELLMPAEIVSQETAKRFGGPIDGTLAHDDLAFLLSAGTGKTIQPTWLARIPQIDRAQLFARASSFGGPPFDPLCKAFEVSVTAMGYRLLQLGLVS